MTTNAMNNDNTNTTAPKFREEGKGYTLSMLDAGYTPVYYGFNCRPRQVRYYKVEKSVETVLGGHCSRSVAEAFLAKVKKGYDKAMARHADLDAQASRAENAFRTAPSSDARNYARKERNRLATAHYNHSFKVDALADCVKKLEAYLA